MIHLQARYEPVRWLGSGGMAEITLARRYFEEGVSTLVTLKRMLPEHVGDHDMRLMFLDEARLQAELAHPHITRALGFEIIDDAPVLVLEWIDGANLRDLLAGARDAGSRPLSPRAVLTIGVALAEALTYAHELVGEAGEPLDIVHRDVNPSNALIGYNGAVKLADFGIARAESHAHVTRTGVLKGTLGYMAPEQLERGAAIDFRTDLYSLGVTLHEMALGVLPFPDLDEIAAAAHPARAGYRLGDRLRAYPPSLTTLLESCLAAIPADRPRSTRELTQALRDVCTELGGPLTMTELGGLARTLVPPGELTVVAPNAPAEMAARFDRSVAAETEAGTEAPPSDVDVRSRSAKRPPALIGLGLVVLVVLIALGAYLLGRAL
jgi:serine/threonine-protein kinase